MTEVFETLHKIMLVTSILCTLYIAGLGWIGWQVFSVFGKLRTTFSDKTSQKLSLQSAGVVADVDRFPKDRDAIISSLFLFREVSDELHETSRACLMTVATTAGLSLVIYAVVYSYVGDEVNIVSVITTVFGSSGILAALYITVRLHLLANLVRKTI